VDPKGRNMRSTPHLPLATPEANPKKIMKKGKYSQEGFSTVVPSNFGHFSDSTINTLVAISSSPLLPSIEIYRNLDLEDLHVEYSSFSPKLKEEIF
jgi:hypothetical protein